VVGDGFFTSLFDILGSAAEAAPQVLPAITPYFEQNDPRKYSYSYQRPAVQPFVAPVSAPAASDNSSSLLWLALALMAGLAIAKR
jgi:hypothetical protein